MPKESKTETEQPTEALAEYPFTLRNLTLTDVFKVPGAERYSSREFGVPFATFELGWGGTVAVPADPADRMGEMAAAVKELMRWLKATGTDLGREIVVDIGLDRAEAALGGGPGSDMEL